MSHFYFGTKNDKDFSFNIAYFRNFEISAYLYLAPPCNKRCTSPFQNLISTKVLIGGNTVTLFLHR